MRKKKESKMTQGSRKTDYIKGNVIHHRKMNKTGDKISFIFHIKLKNTFYVPGLYWHFKFHITSSFQQLLEVGLVIFLILQRKKLKYREVKCLALVTQLKYGEHGM